MVIPQTIHFSNITDKMLNIELRAAIPLCENTPNAVLHRVGGIPLARIFLERDCLRLAAGLNSLGNTHALRGRGTRWPSVGTLKFISRKKLSKRPDIILSSVQRA